jgi:orotate phosphoribosyltransferase
MNEPLIQLLDGCRGHFELESGYHAEWWFDLDVLFERPNALQPFVTELARRLATHELGTVCGPMTGGAKLARLVAAELNLPYCFTERRFDSAAQGLFTVRYEVPDGQRYNLDGKKVAIVDDAVSAVSAARGTYSDLLDCGAQPVVLGALFVFGDNAKCFAAERNMALETLATMPIGVWRPDECPLCRQRKAVEKLPTAKNSWE